MEDEGAAVGVARAILDGTPVDWSSAELGETDRALLDELKVLARVADVHRGPPMLAPGERWGHLEIRERLGAGAQGSVYRAWDPRLERDVALKLVTAPAGAGASASAMLEEGRLLARVRHPNVVTIFGAEQIGGQVGFWMELVEGRTLEAQLAGGRRFSTAEAARTGLGVCQAMAAVHAAGLLHRDIKASNVMLADDGRVVLMDFGVGRRLDGQETTAAAGTPLYLAPEVLSGRPPTSASDIYSAGVLLYRVLTGAYPVTGRTLDDLRQAHLRGRRPDLRAVRPDVPRRLREAVETALAPEPRQRHASASAMADALLSASRSTRAARWWLAGAASAAMVLWLASAGVERPGPEATESARTGIAATAGGPGAAEVPVIAVLPLENLSAAEGSDYFADGLTDEIIRNLAAIDGLDVRSRTSSFYFKRRPRSLPEVARQLGVTHVVEGSVQRDGRRLRVNAQLVQVEGDILLWSERFDRGAEDVFAVQDEISRAIVNRFRLVVGGGARRYDTNVELYDRYLKARALLDQRNIGSGSQEAATLLEYVVARDPGFAPAHAALAQAYSYMSMSPYSLREDVRGRIGPAAARALGLDPLLAEAHAAMGWAKAQSLDWRGAVSSFRRALDLDPSLTSAAVDFSYSTLRGLGWHDEAEGVLRAALRHDPLSVDAGRELAGILLGSGQYQAALDEVARVGQMVLVEHDQRLVRDLARALILTGRHEEVLARFANPSSYLARPGAQHWLALAYVRSGQRGEVERMAVEDRAYPFRMAFIEAALGNTDGALTALERMFVGERQRVATAMMQPELAMLRDHPRFVALRKALAIPDGPLPVEPGP